MEVRLDAFSSPDYDVKEWLNQQFVSIDATAAFEPALPQMPTPEKPDPDQNSSTDKGSSDRGRNVSESMTQRLTTQLHILATNAQQGNDRIKARFRHQAAQISRDIAALAKLIGETQKHMAELSTEIEAQKPTTHAVERLVHIDTARQRLQRSVAALDHLRSYTDLPQKINSFLENGDLAQVWRLIDSIEEDVARRGSLQHGLEKGSGGAGVEVDVTSIGLDADEIEKYKKRVTAAAMDRLEKAIRDHDAEELSFVGKLLASHGHGNRIERTFIDIRADTGLEKLRPAMRSAQSGSNIGDLLGLVADLVAQDRMFIDSTEIQVSAGLLVEQLLADYIEALQPSVVARMAELQKRASSPGADGDSGANNGEPTSAILDLYQTLVRFYSDIAETLSTQGSLSVGGSMPDSAKVLAQPIPRSLRLLFDPFVQYMRSGLPDQHVAAIRSGSLDRLTRIADPASSDDNTFAREAPERILEVFLDVDRALSRVFAFVPASALYAAVASVTGLVTEVAGLIAGRLDAIASRCGIPLLEFAEHAVLAFPQLSSGAIFRPLASEEKLEAVLGIVGVSVSSRLFDQCATALSTSMARRLEELIELLRLRYPSDEGMSSTTEDAITTVRLGALMESCTTVAEMHTIVSRLETAAGKAPGIETIGDALSMLGRRTASAVVFALAAPFSAPLARIPGLGAWHSERESRSSMNIQVPLFSYSPSEEAVDIGEKMHILLPELEQVESMDHQEMRGAQLGAEELQPVFVYVAAWLLGAGSQEIADTQVPPIQSMLSLVLAVVLRCISSQICAIKPPLSASGREQLVADVDYIASVVSSFASPPCQEFDTVQRCLVRDSDPVSASVAEAESDSAAQTRAKMQALLKEQQ
ncbi:hypothetical protein IW140_003269 [Coemansia sp. RSA 1813]|nr:hypothetical protein EV178_002888 [Coemansia sp. RSA 1646]KAJ1771678.1 hypothetical protein LPJ74_002105 [Coemansia sp. RSA 1843]KAJ2089685.1 hypothetical protein IW138_003283 [Coemansia sp. RSA 986]KAJ2214119.1 hypothetical protein EV179_003258 [Coemansia sp. RSA 487]KAJ2569177.1 hypothetical protein IW140_003269 [Coemansia sp. RSA 1813]